MGTFTMVLKDVVEMEKGKIGLDDYPIFDPDYRESLNQKILDHYWNQEIGQETISMFRHALKRKMNEIMPLYNQHYVLSLLTVDPLSTMSIRSLTQAEGESNGTTQAESTGSNSSTSGAKSRAVASDTPQTSLEPDADYATSMQDSVSDSVAAGEAHDTNTGKATEKNTQESENSTNGYQGHAPMLILQARQALVNVDMMVINELRDLFMLIWSNNDSYTNNNNRYGYSRYGF